MNVINLTKHNKLRLKIVLRQIQDFFILFLFLILLDYTIFIYLTFHFTTSKIHSSFEKKTPKDLLTLRSLDAFKINGIFYDLAYVNTGIVNAKTVFGDCYM